MKTLMFAVSCCLTILVSDSLPAQEPPEFPEPTEQHEILKKFAGDWTTRSKAVSGEGEPEMVCEGTMSSRMLGGFWVVSRFEGRPNGQPMSAQLTIGYDPEARKYVGTWTDSMTSHLWNYEGEYDKETKTLSLRAKGPNFMDGGEMSLFRDTYTFTSKDHIEMTSAMQGPDGEWIEFMSGDFRRAE